MTTPELNARIEKLIQSIPPYGEFSLLPYNQSDAKAIAFLLTSDLAKNINFTVMSEEEHKRDIELNEETLQYLVAYGFAINRHDIKEGKVFRQLTDRGRKLKELGTMEGFHRHVSFAEGDEEYLKQLVRHNYLLTYWIALATIVAGIYALLQIFQILFPSCFSK